MKLLLDEHLDPVVSELLEEKGFKVRLLKDLDEGIEDVQVVELAKKQGFIVVTRDSDFLKLDEEFDEMPGVVKINGFPEPSELADSIAENLGQLSEEDLKNAVIYV